MYGIVLVKVIESNHIIYAYMSDYTKHRMLTHTFEYYTLHSLLHIFNAVFGLCLECWGIFFLNLYK